MSPGLEVLRASYRNIERGRQLLNPDEIYELRLENLITSNVFHKGHLISGADLCLIFPGFLA
jgi:hypothetical protein